MEQKKKVSVGTIIFLVLDALMLSRTIVMLFSIRRFPGIFEEFGIEVPRITQLVLPPTGYILTFLVIIGSAGIVAWEYLSKKIITIKTTIIAFVLLLLWQIVTINCIFLPLYKIGGLAK